MNNLTTRFSLRRLLFFLIGWLILLWFESSLGLIFLTFLSFSLISPEVSLLEWLIFGFLGGFWLSVWFVMPWWLGFGLFSIIALVNPGLREKRVRPVSLLLGLIATFVWFGLARVNLSPGLYVLLVIEFILSLVFLPKNQL